MPLPLSKRIIMKIIRPTTITDSILVSSSVPENDYPQWNSATTYNEGDKVIVLAEHKIYEALKTTTNESPSTNPFSWLDLGATNRWAMFDEKIGTGTTAISSISVSLSPGIVTGITLLNIVGALSVTIKMTTTEGVVYDETIGLYDQSNVADWWTYFFEDIRLKSFALILNLPTYRTSTIDITINGETGKAVSVGSLVVGKLLQYANSIDYGASVGIQDYSRKERDEFGNVTIVERAFNKRARWNFRIQNSDVDVFQENLAALRARPAVYIGNDGFNALIVYGFYRDFDTVITYPSHSECSIEIEGLT